jgi:peptide/nickel transport system permease protein
MRIRLTAVLIGIAIIALLAVLAEAISNRDPVRTGYAEGLAPPSPEFPFGTDQLGRDVFTWVLHGLRVSFIVGILSAVIAVGIATLVGLVSGYFGGFIDHVLMRITDIFLSIPRFILILFAVILFSPTLMNIILIIGLFSWPEPARIIRSEVLSARSREYVLAARSIGAGGIDIVFTEIMPNIAPTALAVGALLISDSILIEAALSFLGLGDPDLKARKLVEWLYKLPTVNIVGEDLTLAIEAGRIKLKYMLALTDCYVLAASKIYNCKAVFKRREREMQDKIKELEKNFSIIFLEDYSL